MSTDNNDDYLVQTVFLLLITVLCLGVSWWSMTEGYQSFFGSYGMAAAVATVFVLMLAALNYTLRRGLVKGIGKGKVVAILVIYLLVVMLSFSGMFNKFYSQFMENDLVREEIDQKIDLLNDLEKRGMAVLTNEQADAIRTKVKQLKQDFEREVRSQTEPGIGKKARALLTEIQNLLGRTTPFPVPPTPTLAPKELEAVIKRLHEDIDSEVKKSDTLRKLHAPEKYEMSQRLPGVVKKQIDALTEARSNIGSKSAKSARAAGLEAIQSAVDTYKKAGSDIAAVVKEGEGFKYDKSVRVVNDRIGEIPHSYESARQHLDRGVVWIAALIALGIDLIVPIFVFFLTPRSGVSGGGRIGRGQRGASGLKTEY